MRKTFQKERYFKISPAEIILSLLGVYITVDMQYLLTVRLIKSKGKTKKIVTKVNDAKQDITIRVVSAQYNCNP